MKKVYNNPPLVEVIFEIELENNNWDPAVPGIIYSNLKDTFPNRKEGSHNTIRISSDNPTPEIVRTSIAKFSTEDESTFVQVGPDLLMINKIKNYTVWEEYFELIKKTIEVYFKELSPIKINKISLKYLNQINIGEENLKIEDYFNFRPNIEAKITEEISSFIVGIKIPYNESEDILKLVLNNTKPNKPNETSFILELEYYSNAIDKVENLTEWLGKANKIIKEKFEACITDKSRSLFGEVNEYDDNHI
ncbi:MAG: TIGR04255 family protein [Bacillota bacterium]